MDFLPDVEKCLEVLSRGGIILYPTDTVWGLGCDATNEEAVQKLYLLKQRPVIKSMVVLVADERGLKVQSAILLSEAADLVNKAVMS